MDLVMSRGRWDDGAIDGIDGCAGALEGYIRMRWMAIPPIPFTRSQLHLLSNHHSIVHPHT